MCGGCIREIHKEALVLHKMGMARASVTGEHYRTDERRVIKQVKKEDLFCGEVSQRGDSSPRCWRVGEF